MVSERRSIGALLAVFLLPPSLLLTCARASAQLIDVSEDVAVARSVSWLWYVPFFPPLPFVTFNKLVYANSEYIVCRQGFLGTGDVTVRPNETIVSLVAQKDPLYIAAATAGIAVWWLAFGFPIGILAVNRGRRPTLWGGALGGVVVIGYALILAMLVTDRPSVIGATVSSLCFWAWLGALVFLAWRRKGGQGAQGER